MSDLAPDPVSCMDADFEHNTKANAARRRFLQRIGVMGVSALTASSLPMNVSRGGSLLAADIGSSAASDEPVSGVSSERRWGLLIDTSKCSAGCDACVRGCHEEHGIGVSGNDHTDAQWIRKIDLEDNDSGETMSLPVMCQHCETAPCVDVCPTGASFKRADGVVLVNKHTCIGCRYCMLACPYKARSYIHEPVTDQLSRAPRGKGTVESCTLCVHRIDDGQNLQPACAVACRKDAHSAIVFGDLNNPDSEISKSIREHDAKQVRADLQLNTAVRYTGL